MILKKKIINLIFKFKKLIITEDLKFIFINKIKLYKYKKIIVVLIKLIEISFQLSLFNFELLFKLFNYFS